MRVCAYEPCDTVIDDDADERKRFCMDRHRYKQWKLEAERREARAKRAAMPKPPRPSGAQVPFSRAVIAAEKAMYALIGNAQASDEEIRSVARAYMLAALPERQRQKVLEAGK